MGDRFYQQQNEYFNSPRGKKTMTKKPTRRLKKDAIDELTKALGAEIKLLERLTIATIDELTEAVKELKEKL